MGGIADQCINLGNTFIMIDPKKDKFLPHILKEAADSNDIPFYYLDLNDAGKGSYAPFEGGIVRDRRSRLLIALGLQETGGESDFYKLGERKDIDTILKETGSSIKGLIHELQKEQEDKQAKRALAALKEIAEISTFTPRKGRGISVEEILKEKCVLYVRGSLTDDVIIKMQKSFIMELTQEAMRLEEEGVRTTHATVLADEVKFLVSDQLAKALSTIAGFNCNMILAYQSPTQLENLYDVNMNGEAIATEIRINCQTKIIHRMADDKLAEWAAGQTGEAWKTVVKAEKTMVNNMGGERWGEERMIHKQDDFYIPKNVFISLPQMVGVLICPGMLSKVMFTSFVRVEMYTDFKSDEYKNKVSKKVDSDKKPGDSKLAVNKLAVNKQTKSKSSETSTDNVEPETEISVADTTVKRDEWGIPI